MSVKFYCYKRELLTDFNRDTDKPAHFGTVRLFDDVWFAYQTFAYGRKATENIPLFIVRSEDGAYVKDCGGLGGRKISIQSVLLKEKAPEGISNELPENYPDTPEVSLKIMAFLSKNIEMFKEKYKVDLSNYIDVLYNYYIKKINETA